MSTWTNLTFDLDDDRLDAAELTLREAVEAEGSRQYYAGIDENGTLSTKCSPEAVEPICESVLQSGERAFALTISDASTNTGWVEVYERVDGSIEQIDEQYGDDWEFGDDVVEWARDAYDIELFSGTGLRLSRMFKELYGSDVIVLEREHKQLCKLRAGEDIDHYYRRQLREEIGAAYIHKRDLCHAIADGDWERAVDEIESVMQRPPISYDFEQS